MYKPNLLDFHLMAGLDGCIMFTRHDCVLRNYSVIVRSYIKMASAKGLSILQ